MKYPTHLCAGQNNHNIFSSHLMILVGLQPVLLYYCIVSVQKYVRFKICYYFCMFSMYFSPVYLRNMNDFRSCRYMENRRGDRFFPCRTPMLQVKKYDCASVINAARDLAFSYMFLMTSNNLPEIPDASIFDHKVALLIVSKVFF